MSETNAITVQGLTKHYEGFTLDSVSFQVPTGSIVGFIGENGAGKSTTIKAMLGLIPVDGGEVSLLGHLMQKNEKEVSYREQIGVVFDECNLQGGLRIRSMNRIMKSIYRTWQEERFHDYCRRFGLTESKTVKELSRGMKMKLSIAIALSHDSRLLILDEATGGLDPVVRSEILDLFREFVEDEGHSVFLSSHITSDVEKIADYVMVIHQGRLLLTESKDELLYQYGVVRCTKEQALLIPGELIVGKEEGSYETSVLVKSKEQLLQTDFLNRAQNSSRVVPVIERASLEDILLFSVRSNLK